MDVSREIEWRPDTFLAFVLKQGEKLYRDLPWRRTRDAYAIWISETMLQQTQVVRVDGRWQQWLCDFPTLASLARAPQAAVLNAWLGLGYNRRALNLMRAAKRCVQEFGAELPHREQDLLSLPGIGPATAAGIRVFARSEPALYLETNVRSVMLHYLFPDAVQVPDKELYATLAAVVPHDSAQLRPFYYALLDIGAHLKRTQPNPSRRSATHTTQSRYEGSRRQKRSALLRILLAHPSGLMTEEAYEALSKDELLHKRSAPEYALVCDILEELAQEGFLEKCCAQTEDNRVAWKCREIE